MPKVDVITTIEEIRIYIDDLLHLSLSRRDLIGVQSYKDAHCALVIEYYLSRGKVKTEYESYDTWKEILRQLAIIRPLFRS